MGKKEITYPIDSTGGRIQHLRRGQGLTRIQFYDKIKPGMATAPESKNRAVKNWESEKTQLDFEGLRTACNVLDCDSDYLLLLQPEPHKVGIQIAEETGLSYEAVDALMN